MIINDPTKFEHLSNFSSKVSTQNHSNQKNNAKHSTNSLYDILSGSISNEKIAMNLKRELFGEKVVYRATVV